MYRRIVERLSKVDVVFIGVECEGVRSHFGWVCVTLRGFASLSVARLIDRVPEQ